MSKYRVEKQSYSRGAWRVLDAATGEQVWKRDTFYHGLMERTVSVPMPVCFERKRDAVAWIAAQEVA